MCNLVSWPSVAWIAEHCSKVNLTAEYNYSDYRMPNLSPCIKERFSFFYGNFFNFVNQKYKSDFQTVFLLLLSLFWRKWALHGKKRRFNKIEYNNTIPHRILGQGIQLFLPLRLKAFLRGSIWRAWVESLKE